MPTTQKQSISTHNAKKFKIFNKKRLILSCLVVIVLLVATSIVVVRLDHARAVAAENADFAQAEKDIDVIVHDIVAKIGDPLRKDQKEWCSRPNLKFREGPLSCSTETRLYYAIQDSVQSEAYSQMILKSPNDIWGSPRDIMNEDSSTLFSKLSDPYTKNDSQKKLALYMTSKKMKCNLSLYYYKTSMPPFDDFLAESHSKDLLSVSILCTSSVSSNIY